MAVTAITPASRALTWGHLTHSLLPYQARHLRLLGVNAEVVSLAAGLALEGYKVLLIDTDPQANTHGAIRLGRDSSCLGNSLGDPENNPSVLKHLKREHARHLNRGGILFTRNCAILVS